MGELVDDVERTELAPIMGALLEEVVVPDVIGAFRLQPDARDAIVNEHFGYIVVDDATVHGLAAWHAVGAVPTVQALEGVEVARAADRAPRLVLAHDHRHRGIA